MSDKNTPGPWVVRVRRERCATFGTEPAIVDCFVQAPDVHGYAYGAEILGDDEYREETGMQRKLADCQVIAAALVMREALRVVDAWNKGQGVQWVDMRNAVTSALDLVNRVPK